MGITPKQVDHSKYKQPQHTQEGGLREGSGPSRGEAKGTKKKEEGCEPADTEYDPCSGRVIHLKRIYNFFLLHTCFV